MLTGRRLFDGETISHTLADVLRAEIRFDSLPVGIPAAIVNLLRRCLDRDPKQRLRDIGEARVIIERTISGADTQSSNGAARTVDPGTLRQAKRFGTRAVAVSLIAIAGLAIAAGTLWSGRSTREQSAGLLRLNVDLGLDHRSTRPASSCSRRTARRRF